LPAPCIVYRRGGAEQKILFETSSFQRAEGGEDLIAFKSVPVIERIQVSFLHDGKILSFFFKGDRRGVFLTEIIYDPDVVITVSDRFDIRIARIADQQRFAPGNVIAVIKRKILQDCAVGEFHPDRVAERIAFSRKSSMEICRYAPPNSVSCSILRPESSAASSCAQADMQRAVDITDIPVMMCLIIFMFMQK